MSTLALLPEVLRFSWEKLFFSVLCDLYQCVVVSLFLVICIYTYISCCPVSTTHYLHDTTQSVPGDSHVVALVWALKKVIWGTCFITKIYYNGRKLLQIE